MTVRIGVDIGGSGVRAAVVETDAPVDAWVEVGLKDRQMSTVVDAVVEAVRQLNVTGAYGVGVGVPGFVRGGIVVASPNFPSWQDVDLKAILGARLECPISIENDANAAALGAAYLLGCRDLIALTLGTGVGGGVVVDGKLVRGAVGPGAEIGHIWGGGDAPCGCGGYGCLEMSCGTVGLKYLSARQGVTIAAGAEVIESWAQREPWAEAVREEANLAMGRGLVTLANLFSPTRFSICGGLADPQFWDAAVRIFQERVIPAHRCPVTIGGRAERFAIVGAAKGLEGGV